MKRGIWHSFCNFCSVRMSSEAVVSLTTGPVLSMKASEENG